MVHLDDISFMFEVRILDDIPASSRRKMRGVGASRSAGIFAVQRCSSRRDRV